MKQETSETNENKRPGKLKEILLEEGTTLIPWAGLFRKPCECWNLPIDENGNKSPKSFRRGFTNGIVSMTISLYVASALCFGANPLNPRDYLQKQHEWVERGEEKKKDYSERQFYEADRNGDGFLSVKEFYEYNLNRGRKNKNE